LRKPAQGASVGGVCVTVAAFRGVGGWRYDALWGNQRGKAAFCD